jgi:hypothetical protein
MQALSSSTSGASAPLAPAPPPNSPLMDREFIARNQIIERYLSGRLPPKGAQDFERYCRENAHSLDEIGLSDQITKALRLLEAGGIAPPWEIAPKRWWERLPVLIVSLALAVVLAITVMGLAAKLGASERSLSSLHQRMATQALDPALSTRTITVIPDRTGAPEHSQLAIGGRAAEMADLKIDVSWSKFTDFRVTIDRVDQGRVALLHNVLRDSNGQLLFGLNSSALGPGDYLFTIEGVNWRGEVAPQAWTRISIAH